MLVPGATRTLRCIGGHPEHGGAVSPLCGGGSDRVWQPLRYVMRDAPAATAADDDSAAARCASAKIARVEGCTVDTAAPVVVRGVEHGECSFMYRYILRESRSQFDSLPLTSL